MGFDYNAEIGKARKLELMAADLTDYARRVTSSKIQTQEAWSENRVSELDTLYDDIIRELYALDADILAVAKDIRIEAENIKAQEEEAARIAAEQAQARARQEAEMRAAEEVRRATELAAAAANTYIPIANISVISPATLKRIQLLEDEKAKLENNIKKWSRFSFFYSSQIKQAKKQVEDIDKELKRLRK